MHHSYFSGKIDLIWWEISFSSLLLDSFERTKVKHLMISSNLCGSSLNPVFLMTFLAN